jgi:hypothetical protein
MNNFIFNMINPTKTTDGSWLGEAHALVLNKMLRVRIVIFKTITIDYRVRLTVIIGFLRAIQDFQKSC